MSDRRQQAAVSAAITVLVIAAAFQIAGLPEPAATAAFIIAVVAAAIFWVRKIVGLHIVRASDGPAFIYTITSPAGDALRVLSQGGVFQSATYLDERRFEPVFAYHRAFDRAFDLVSAPAGRPLRALALGGGGYAWPKHAIAAHPELALDVVEIDPKVTQIARRWFFLADLERMAGGRLGLITADARAYLDAPATPVYDIIVSDVFHGAEPVRALATVEAARAALAHLAPDGAYLMNVVSTEAGRDLTFLRDEVASLLQVFAHVCVIPAEDEDLGGEDNYLVIASRRELGLSDAIPFDDDFPGTPLTDAGLKPTHR